jgi:hypothetical protein
VLSVRAAPEDGESTVKAINRADVRTKFFADCAAIGDGKPPHDDMSSTTSSRYPTASASRRPPRRRSTSTTADRQRR